MQWVGDRQPFDRKRVAIMGEGFGRYLALRGVELYPDLFRCAIIINAPTNLKEWHEPRMDVEETERMIDTIRMIWMTPGAKMGDMLANELPPEVDFAAEIRLWLLLRQGSGVKALSAGEHAELIRRPVFIIHDAENRIVSVTHARKLHQVLKRRDREVEFLDVSPDFTAGALSTRQAERMRRQWAASEAQVCGWGGLSAVSAVIGMSSNTIRKGLGKLALRAKDPTAPIEARLRRKGGGRKRQTEVDPELQDALNGLVEPGIRGDPESLLRWTCKSTTRLAEELERLGHRVSPRTVGRPPNIPVFACISRPPVPHGSTS